MYQKTPFSDQGGTAVRRSEYDPFGSLLNFEVGTGVQTEPVPDGLGQKSHTACLIDF